MPNLDADISALLSSIATVKSSIASARRVADKVESVYGRAFCSDMMSLAEEYAKRVRLSAQDRALIRAGQGELI